jgi:hypothetical protein
MNEQYDQPLRLEHLIGYNKNANLADQFVIYNRFDVWDDSKPKKKLLCPEEFWFVVNDTLSKMRPVRLLGTDKVCVYNYNDPGDRRTLLNIWFLSSKLHKEVLRAISLADLVERGIME